MAENMKKPKIEHITVNEGSKVPMASGTIKVLQNLMALPDEILLHVFSHLSIYDILQRVALVCKRFYNLSKDSSLILNIDAEKYDKKECQRSFHQRTIHASQNMTALIIRGHS